MSQPFRPDSIFERDPMPRVFISPAFGEGEVADVDMVDPIEDRAGDPSWCWF